MNSILGVIIVKQGYPGGASGKEPAFQCRRHKRCEFHPWLGKITWRRSGRSSILDPLQCSCLENPMDTGAQQPTVQRVAESDTTWHPHIVKHPIKHTHRQTHTRVLKRKQFKRGQTGHLASEKITFEGRFKGQNQSCGCLERQLAGREPKYKDLQLRMSLVFHILGPVL